MIASIINKDSLINKNERISVYSGYKYRLYEINAYISKEDYKRLREQIESNLMVLKNYKYISSEKYLTALDSIDYVMGKDMLADNNLKYYITFRQQEIALIPDNSDVLYKDRESYELYFDVLLARTGCIRMELKVIK